MPKAQASGSLKKDGTPRAGKAAAKEECHPPDDSCPKQHCYGEWEQGTDNKWILQVRSAKLEKPWKTATTTGMPLDHVTVLCDKGEQLQKDLIPADGSLKCNGCPKTFSKKGNLKQHAMCGNKHLICITCNKEVTTVAAARDHFKTANHHTSTHGWTIDGVKKSTVELENNQNGKKVAVPC
ncbi:hypothetical protein DFJ74DRAFT_705788 [Hyaloraphidium curvatum]|nr:hypothetical protein DFJ74DRAFT_705788 [Hyaloraphidium curvatum]